MAPRLWAVGLKPSVPEELHKFTVSCSLWVFNPLRPEGMEYIDIESKTF